MPGGLRRDAMTTNRVRATARVTAAVVGGSAIAACAWWATGLHPFTTGSYVAVGLPVIALVIVVLRHQQDGSHRNGLYAGGERSEIGVRTAFPWLLLVAVAVGLEVWGLSLGGQSSTVPTVSTVVDHAMSWHVVRFVLFCGWLAAGWAAEIRVASRNCRADT